MTIKKDGDMYLVAADNFVNLQESKDYFFINEQEYKLFMATNVQAQIVKVVWRDSLIFGHGEWAVDDIEGVATIETVGYLVADREGYVAVARELVNGGGYRGMIIIPKENITSRENLGNSKRGSSILPR